MDILRHLKHLTKEHKHSVLLQQAENMSNLHSNILLTHNK